MAKDVGAKKVIVASCAPPIRLVSWLALEEMRILDSSVSSHSNVYGIDMPSRHELVAYDRDNNSIATAIGADLVIFQTLPDLISSVRRFNPSITTFDCSVFTGEYVTGGVDEAYLTQLGQLRGDNAGEILRETNSEPRTQNAIEETNTGGRGSMSGADDTVGLYNSWRGKAELQWYNRQDRLLNLVQHEFSLNDWTRGGVRWVSSVSVSIESLPCGTTHQYLPMLFGPATTRSLPPT